MTTWTIYQVPSQRRMYAVRAVADGEYLEGDYEDATHAAGIPHWLRKDAEAVAAWLNGLA